jgi:hypothetical protein
MDILTPIISWAVSKACAEAYRAASAWWSLDDHMPKVSRAFNKVREELYDVGLLAEDTYLDKIDLIVSAIPSYGEAGYVYERVGWLDNVLGFKPGVIYLPSDLPHDAYVPGGTLTDVIRHEFAHAWHWIDPELIDRRWFRSAFGADYTDTDTKPSDIWKQKLKRDKKFQQRFTACRNERERKSQIRRRLLNDFVSEYATTLAREDFAETFMFYLRNRNCLDRFKTRTGVYLKLKAVETAVSKARKQNGL